MKIQQCLPENRLVGHLQANSHMLSIQDKSIAAAGARCTPFPSPWHSCLDRVQEYSVSEHPGAK